MSDTFEGHGWSVVPHWAKREEDQPGAALASLHVGRLPGRKQVCLYGHNGTPGLLRVYAYFPTEELAREALSILDRLMKR